MTESAPHLRSEPLKVRISTYLMETPEVDETLRIIDLCNDSDRKWLGKHAFWALCNGRGISQEPVE